MKSLEGKQEEDWLLEAYTNKEQKWDEEFRRERRILKAKWEEEIEEKQRERQTASAGFLLGVVSWGSNQ